MICHQILNSFFWIVFSANINKVKAVLVQNHFSWVIKQHSITSIRKLKSNPIFLVKINPFCDKSLLISLLSYDWGILNFNLLITVRRFWLLLRRLWLSWLEYWRFHSIHGFCRLCWHKLWASVRGCCKSQCLFILKVLSRWVGVKFLLKKIFFCVSSF